MQWLKDFLWDYLPWTIADKVLETTAGAVLLTFLGGVLLSAISYVLSFFRAVRPALKHVALGALLATTAISAFLAAYILLAPAPTAETYAQMSNASLRSSAISIASGIRKMVARNTAKQNELLHKDRDDFEDHGSNVHRHTDVHSQFLREYLRLGEELHTEYAQRFQAAATLLRDEITSRLSPEAQARAQEDRGTYQWGRMPDLVADDLEQRALLLPLKDLGPG